MKIKQDVALYFSSLYLKLKNSRQSLERTWKEVDSYIKPSNTNNNIFDATAINSCETLVSGLWSLINSSAENWFYLKNKNIQLNDNAKIKEWLLSVDSILKQNLYESFGGFYYKSYEFYFDLVCYGTAIFSCIEDSKNKKIVHNTHNLFNTYLYKHSNQIDTVISELFLTPLEAVDKFGEDNLPQTIKNALQNNEDKKFLFLHIVLPSKYVEDVSFEAKNMEYASYYIEYNTKQIILKNGYYTFPFMIARWYTNTKEIYGISPAINALPDIKMLNAISKTIIVSAQKQIDPPLLATNESSVSGIKTAPGSVIYGAIDPVSGNQLIKPLLLGSDSSGAKDLHFQRKEALKELFYNHLLSFNYSRNATATEILAVNEQKLRILGSKISRLQSEFLYPLLKRQIFILQNLDLFPEIPIELKEVFSINDIEIDFTSAWNKYLKVANNINLNDLSYAINTIKQFDQNIADNVNWQGVLKTIIEQSGLNENLFNFNNSEKN
jgi:hypothetical protein